MSPPIQSCLTSEESYCAPWDLKTQEEKLKLLNEQHQLSSLTDTLLHSSNQSSLNHKSTFHRTYSARTSSKIKQTSTTHRVPSPSHQCSTNKIFDPPFKRISSCFNSHSIRSSTAISRSFLFASTPSTVAKNDTQSMSYEVCSLYSKKNHYLFL